MRSSIWNPSSSSKRTARRSRSGSSTKTVSVTARTTPARRSPRPSCGSYGAPVSTLSAIALNVKSRVARSASIPSRERREVHRLVDAVGDHAPGAVALGEREHGAAEAAREPVGRVARIGARDVEVEDGTEEELVPNRTSDDPGALPAQDLAEPLIHRRRPAERVRNVC